MSKVNVFISNVSQAIKDYIIVPLGEMQGRVIQKVQSNPLLAKQALVGGNVVFFAIVNKAASMMDVSITKSYPDFSTKHPALKNRSIACLTGFSSMMFSLILSRLLAMQISKIFLGVIVVSSAALRLLLTPSQSETQKIQRKPSAQDESTEQNKKNEKNPGENPDQLTKVQPKQDEILTTNVKTIIPSDETTGQVTSPLNKTVSSNKQSGKVAKQNNEIQKPRNFAFGLYNGDDASDEENNDNTNGSPPQYNSLYPETATNVVEASQTIETLSNSKNINSEQKNEEQEPVKEVVQQENTPQVQETKFDDENKSVPLKPTQATKKPFFDPENPRASMESIIEALQNDPIAGEAFVRQTFGETDPVLKKTFAKMGFDPSKMAIESILKLAKTEEGRKELLQESKMWKFDDNGLDLSQAPKEMQPMLEMLNAAIEEEENSELIIAEKMASQYPVIADLRERIAKHIQDIFTNAKSITKPRDARRQLDKTVPFLEKNIGQLAKEIAKVKNKASVEMKESFTKMLGLLEQTLTAYRGFQKNPQSFLDTLKNHQHVPGSQCHHHSGHDCHHHG